MSVYIRPATLDDLDALEECVSRAGIGLINLPRDRESLEKRIRLSEDSFSKQVSFPQEEEYFFVLVRRENNAILGTAGIYANLGKAHPLYVYQIDPKGFMTPKQYRGNVSEVCALYIIPEMRKEGFGKLLSLGRFLFIAAHPERFSDQVIANMRGFIQDNRSPFWESVGKQMCKDDFNTVMGKRLQNDQFIGEFLTNKRPIPVDTIPEEAREAIGKPHPHTQPAVAMLMREGFTFSENIDPIDGGPILIADTQKIKTVKQSQRAQVVEFDHNEMTPSSYLVSNESMQFRCCYSKLQILKERVIVPIDTANTLNIKIGDSIRYI